MVLNRQPMIFARDIHERDCKMDDLQTVRVPKSTNNQNDAQETVREAFLKAYQQLEQFQENSRHLTRLIEIAVNQCLMKLER